MAEAKIKWIHIFNIMVSIAIAIVLIVLFATVQHFRSDSAYDNPASTIHNIDDNWVCIGEDGSITDFTEFNTRLDVNEITLSRIFIFDMDNTCNAISFKARYAAVEVYQDGDLIYSYGNPDDAKSGTLLGVYRCVVPLEVYYGEASEIEIHLVSNMNLKVNSFYYGSTVDSVSSKFSNSLMTTIFSIFMIVIALVMMALAIIGHKRIRFTVEYYYFTIFVLFAAIWAITDIQILSALGVTPGILCIISYECFSFMGIPFIIYMYYTCRRFKMVDIVSAILLFMNFIAVNILHFTKVMNFTQSVSSTQALLVLTLAVSAVQVVIGFIKDRTPRDVVMFICFLIVGIGGAVQLFDFYGIQKYGSSSFLQTGIVLFVIFNVGTLFSGLFKLVDEGRKAEDYLSMAKTDSLTGLGNRRGLDLYIADIAKNSAPFYRLGCIVCDLNDLKKTNDVYGHDVGDRLIKDFAKCLQVCFENRGKVFRTGGDEFYVMFSDVEVDMSAMMRRLSICLDGSNSTAEYKISCSRGCYADYVAANNVDAVWDIIKFADAEMYKMKKADRAKRKVDEGSDR